MACDMGERRQTGSGGAAHLQILLATYNSSRFLREQLDSILAQDCRDFELLIRDGGSSDDTLGIIEDYRRKYPETIRFMGSSAATAPENFAALLDSSTAPLIMFSDHDDVWKPDKVRLTLRKYCEMEAEFGSGTILHPVKRRAILRESEKGGDR